MRKPRIIAGTGSRDLSIRNRILLSSLIAVSPWLAPNLAYGLDRLDLTVAGMEVTQGIQCYDTDVGDMACEDNSLPLIAQRPTVVRLYLNHNLFDGERVDGITARLYVRRETGDEPGEPLVPANGPIGLEGGAAGTLGAQRSSADRTLNFRVPPGWLAGRLVLRPLVNPASEGGPREVNRENNWGEDLVVEFGGDCHLTIAYLPRVVRRTGARWAHRRRFRLAL